MAKSATAGFLVCLVGTLGLLSGDGWRTQLFPAVREGSWVLSLTRDHDGLIWVAASSGVFRFDGLHYHAVPGYPFSAARFIAANAVGDIWVGGSEGLARYQNDGWKVVANQPVEAMAMGPSGLWVLAGGLRLISEEGGDRSFPAAKPTGELVVDGEGALWFPCGQNACTMRPPDWRIETKANPAAGNWKKIVPEKGGNRYWVSSVDEIAVVRGNVVEGRQKAESLYRLRGQSELLDPYLSPNGTVWGTRNRLQPIPGLRLWPVLSDGLCSYFEGESTHWFCGAGAGKSVRSGDWQTWTSAILTAASPEGFLRSPNGTPLLFSSRGVLEFSRDPNGWIRPQFAPKIAVMNMIEDGGGGYWLATKDEGLVRANSDFSILERFPKLCPDVDSIRGLARDRRGRIWVGGKALNCLFEIQGQPGNRKFIPQDLPGGTIETVDLQVDTEGRPWVGYERGIAYLDDSGQWRQIQTSEPITSIRNFDFDGQDVIWVSRRRGPMFFARLERQGDVWKVRRFAGPEYGPPETLYLRRDSRGWIWRGTASEVQVARPGKYEPAEWLRLRLENGIASVGVNLRGWSEDGSGNVWLAGNSGVTRMRPRTEWFDAPRGRRPLMTRLTVDDRTWFDPGLMPHHLPATGGPIEIDLSAMDANPFLKAPLKYRLTPGDGRWKFTSDGRVTLTGLRTGSYALEAAYSGDGVADVMRWEFKVGSPVSPYLLPGLGVGLIGLLAPLGWWRREWLHYWGRKSLFLAGRRFRRLEKGVSWTNYSGRILEQRYLVFDLIARSEFSITYFAKQLKTGQKVVIKVLHRTPGLERSVRHRFAQEVAALHTFSHPGLVRLLDSWISPEGEPCLAMEYLEGPTLRQLLTEEGTLALPRLARIVDQLGAAVGAIHERGIVHRDLKPENVMVLGVGTPNERIVVIDFGSSASRGPVKNQENTITLTGSLHYIAPERLGGQYSPASDVYSLGVMVLEMGSGKRPAEMDITPLEPEFVELTIEWAGRMAAETLVSALQHQPSRRPPSVIDWAADLSMQLREFSERRRDASPST